MFRRASRLFWLSVACCGLIAACTPDTVSDATQTRQESDTEATQTPLQATLIEQVSAAKAEHDLIALGAVIASSEGLLGVSVDGLRARDETDPVQPNDKWHLGSNTKALTALLYGQLVERGLADWTATLPELFPDLASEMDSAWTEVTIEDLFAHRTGFQQMGGFWLNARRNDERPVTEQRREVTAQILSEPPAKDPSEFNYNNLNYIIAGAAIEQILATDETLPQSWEAAMQTLLFDRLRDPVHQNGFGFGAPQAGLQGHRSVFGTFITPVGRGKTADNPAILGPAGTLHGTLAAHALLATEFLKQDSDLIPAALREKLTTRYPDPEGNYAMGWGVYDDPVVGELWLHSGSNTVWYSQIAVSKRLDRVVIVNTNQFSDAAQTAANQVIKNVLIAAQDAQAEQIE
ncbi:MAG: serine hydrolase domain-containing protein [Pseudomonadota bacterium]